MVRNIHLHVDSRYCRWLVRECLQKFESFVMDYVRMVLYRGRYMWNSLCSVVRHFEESSVAGWAVSNVAKVDVEFSSDLIGSRES